MIKKLLFLILICVSNLLVQGQIGKNKTNNCSIEESILLNERPSLISERDAFDVIKGNKLNLLIIHSNKDFEYKQQIKFPFSVLQEMQKRTLISLEKTGKTLPEWKQKTYFVPTGNYSNGDFYLVLIILLLLSFFFGLAFINLIPKLSWDNVFANTPRKVRLKILLAGFILSLFFGSIAYFILMRLFPDSPWNNYTYKYVWTENLLFVFIAYASGLLWIVGIEVNKLFKKHSK